MSNAPSACLPFAALPAALLPAARAALARELPATPPNVYGAWPGWLRRRQQLRRAQLLAQEGFDHAVSLLLLAP